MICTLANLSFAEGCFPAIFKQAIVNPLIKKPGLDKSEPSNFRPISNLNNISKLLERLFLTHFQPYISNSPNFNPLQSAYRKFHSTETSLLNTLDQVYTAADSSQPTVLVSLDLSAAFDTIDHHILLSRLQASFGVSGSAIGWISSYLTGRVQRVVVGLSQSANTSLSTAVPQGSVLGPLLFSIFTSPVGHIISSSGVRHQQYADDTQLFISLSPANLSESIRFGTGWNSSDWIHHHWIHHHSLIVEVADEIIIPLEHIFNMSILTGVVPSDLKIAKVIPIFKKGDKSECCNYRPISLLNVFNKILEKLVYTRVVSFLKKNRIIYTNQFGFRSNHSTNHALINVLDKLYEGLDKGEMAIGVYLDVEKAFDCINHSMLLDKCNITE